MAVATLVPLPATPEFAFVRIYEWVLTTADPDGEPVSVPRLADRTVQFIGDTWGGATATVEGTLFPNESFQVLTNQSTGNITATANDLALISEATFQVRPRLTTVGAGASIRVRVLIRN